MNAPSRRSPDHGTRTRRAITPRRPRPRPRGRAGVRGPRRERPRGHARRGRPGRPRASWSSVLLLSVYDAARRAAASRDEAPTPAENLAAQMRADCARPRTTALDGYGWVDRKAGVVRIPIDRAIDLVAERACPRARGREPRSRSTATSRTPRQEMRTRRPHTPTILLLRGLGRAGDGAAGDAAAAGGRRRGMPAQVETTEMSARSGSTRTSTRRCPLDLPFRDESGRDGRGSATLRQGGR